MNNVMIFQFMKNNSILVVTKKNTDDIKNMAIALNKNLIIYDELEDNEFIYNPLHNNDINFVVEKILSAMELESFQLTPFFKELHYNVLHNAITLLKKYNENCSLSDLDTLLTNPEDNGRKIVMKVKRICFNNEEEQIKYDKLIAWFLNEYYIGMFSDKHSLIYNQTMELRYFISKLVNSGKFNCNSNTIDISPYLQFIPKDTIVICQLYNNKLDNLIYSSMKQDVEYYINKNNLNRNLKDNFFFIYDDEKHLYANRNCFTQSEKMLLQRTNFQIKEENYNNILGNKIKEIRLLHQLNQDELASILDVTKNFISDVERGNKSFSLEKLLYFCSIFDVSLDSLLPKNNEGKLKLEKLKLEKIQEKEYFSKNMENTTILKKEFKENNNIPKAASLPISIKITEQQKLDT